jgi:mono/diheme cytochrome c family protein
MKAVLLGALGAIGLAATTVSAQESMDELIARGNAMFHSPAGCWVCHGPTATGGIGPTLHFGPTPMNIFDQAENNEVMAPVLQELKPTDEDLIGLALYVRQLAGLPLEPGLVEEWRPAIAALREQTAANALFAKTPYDRKVEEIESFETVLSTWTRRAKEGSLKSDYPTRVVRTWEPGEPKFRPRPNRVYFYENLGVQNTPEVFSSDYTPPRANQIVVGDARTKRVLASYELSPDLTSAVHTSGVSADGKYVYIVGPREPGPDGLPSASGATTMIKADALTLQPIKQITIGARIHHISVFRDKYLMIDMFARDPDGLAVLLYDTDTDTVLGGIKDVDLGGFGYTAFTDNEYIYIGVEPAGYAPGRSSGMVGITNIYHGKLQAMRPFWIAKIDPDTWEVVREYPVPGYRPNWIVVDSSSENMYVVMSSSSVSKVNLATGVVTWTGGAGIGPYGATLNADETELWVADKGEGAHHMGRTVTVLDTENGHAVETLFGSYKADHVLLAPNGTEMWTTSNAEGVLYVYDAKTRERTHMIEMPQRGDAHGLIWVHYDENLNARVVRDQGKFHFDVDPTKGRPLAD